MTWVVFSGPTIPPAEVALEVGDAAICRGPAAMGDVYRAQQEGARTIVLIDGYFEHRLSVWHKEILWALYRGVRVYGASSLGALRAVELAPFGMVGIGRVFERFRDGELEDDDEVAVVHAAAEAGYRPLSDAMVSIRATIERAVADGLLEPSAASRLIAMAKSQFYPSRNLRRLVDGVVAELPGLRNFAAALEDGAFVDQKRLDALAALRQVADDQRRGQPEPAEPSFHFEYTEAWHEAVQGLRNPRSKDAPV